MGFFATHVVPTVLYVLKKLTFPLSLFAMLAPAPQEVVDKDVDADADENVDDNDEDGDGQSGGGPGRSGPPMILHLPPSTRLTS